MLKFPYPVAFVAANRKQFRIRVTKPNKRSWWLQLLADDGTPLKAIKVVKTSVKLRYPKPEGGFYNGEQMLKVLIRQRSKDEKRGVN